MVKPWDVENLVTGDRKNLAFAFMSGQTTIVEAIFVPSMAFLDQIDKWVLVIFLEKLPIDRPLEFLPKVEDYGYFNVEI